MITLALFGSRGPFGPTYLTCLLLPFLLFGPFLLIALVARSLLSSALLTPEVVTVEALKRGWIKRP